MFNQHPRSLAPCAVRFCHFSCLSLGLHLVPFSSAPRLHTRLLSPGQLPDLSPLLMVILFIWLDLSSLYRVPAVF